MLPGDEQSERARARRRRYLDAVPAALATGVAEFNQTQLRERDQSRRAGRHPISDITIETRLRVLRDLACHLALTRQLTGWAEVSTADLEDFLALAPHNRHQQSYLLRRFFAWARRHRLVLLDPTTALRLGPQPGFTGTVLAPTDQRNLYQRWTCATTHPHERLIGLLALLHAASNAEIRTLTVAACDPTRQTVSLPGRPFPTPLEPATGAALHAALAHREARRTLNPHVIVTATTRTRTRDTAADGSYLTRRLTPAGTTPATCRQTRLSQLVTDLDPKLTTTALGMHDSGLVRYLADNVDHDRLRRSISPPR